MRTPTLILACAMLAFAAPALAQPTASAASNLDYFIGRWHVVAATPGKDDDATVDYEVRRLVGPWLAGHGLSPALKLDARDVWGRDPLTGELMRTVFDSSGTHAVVRSPGWTGNTLVLEGEARSAGGTVRVRETIVRVGDDAFTATWEAHRDGAWRPYSIERATRQPG